jgi:hypothetical protein
MSDKNNSLIPNYKVRLLSKAIFFILLIGLVFESCKPSKTLTYEEPKIDYKKTEVENSQPVSPNNTNIFWTTHESAKRYTLLSIDSAGKIKILAAQSPEPDFLKNIELDSNIKVQGKIDVVYLLKSQAELTKLNNKSASLSITKEALYRLAEAYFNGLIDSSKYMQLYKGVLTQAADLISEEIELEEARAETIVAETEKAKIELQKAQLEFERFKFEMGTKEENTKVKEEGSDKEER